MTKKTYIKCSKEGENIRNQCMNMGVVDQYKHNKKVHYRSSAADACKVKKSMS